MNNETLKQAVKLLLAAHPVAIARLIHSESDGIDTAQANLEKFASAVRSLAILVSDDRIADADSRLRAMEYGDALHDRIMARAASEYACAIEQAHEDSQRCQNVADDLNGEGDEPTTADAFTDACQAHGV